MDKIAFMKITLYSGVLLSSDLFKFNRKVGNKTEGGMKLEINTSLLQGMKLEVNIFSILSVLLCVF